ncbi:MAG: hypothetical protein V7647_4131, partial [Acidobacteriota bacterium]
GGLQLWDSIRSVDFLESLPYVRPDAIGATGESGGGTQTFLLAAVDDRIAVAVPVNMISLRMQGGCLCENLPGLRLDTTNVEIAATIGPRPLLMISATGDWTAHTIEEEFPAVRSLYALSGSGDRVQAVRIDAQHNYNRESREAMYAWMARWLQGAAPDVLRPERPFTPDGPGDLLVFHQRTLPEGALDAEGVTAEWIDAARRQIPSAGADVLGRALAHALGFGDQPVPAAGSAGTGRKTVLLSSPDAPLEAALRKAGFTTAQITFTPFDTAAAAAIPHFETYNRTPASQRVADIAAALHAHPGATLVASGDAALAGLLAAAVAPVRLAVLDVGSFDTASDADYMDHLYVPGLRRAGGLQTAASAAGTSVLIHNAGERFALDGVRVRHTRLTAEDLVATIRSAR